MTEFAIGDYNYTTEDDDGYVAASVVDKTKTSYEDVPSSVTYDGKTYTVRSVSYCFMDCRRLVNAPSLPDTIENMHGCFIRCYALKSATVPDNVTDMANCFMQCQIMPSAPAIPDGVTNMEHCFQGCRAITSPPTIPNGVTTMEFCFAQCSELLSAPDIPANVSEMSSCFLAADKISGNIRVSNNPSGTDSIFTSSNDIYIIPSGLDAGGEQTWRSIAAQKSNIHYYLDEVELSIEELSVKRVAAKRYRTEDKGGSSSYVRMVLEYGDYAPVGYEQWLSYSVMIDDKPAQPTVAWSEISDKGVTEAWFDPPMSKDSRYTVTVTDNVKNTSTMVAELAKAFALFDAYHGDDGEGIAIGTVANGPGLNIAMDANFGEPFKVGGMVSTPTYMTQSHASYIPAADPCLVLDLTERHLYLYENGRYLQIV